MLAPVPESAETRLLRRPEHFPNALDRRGAAPAISAPSVSGDTIPQWRRHERGRLLARAAWFQATWVYNWLGASAARQVL